MALIQSPTTNANVSTARVSVVVPSYNHAQFVHMTLRSIMKQTHRPAELLVIDDGSKDDSPRAIEAALEDCSLPCELVVRENRGLCATLNEGFARTKGDYFAYLGSDDVWLPDFLRERLRLMQSRADAVLAYGHSYLIDDQNRIFDCTAEWADYADGNVREMLLSTIAPMSPTVLYRRSALEKEPWNEQAKLEDYDLYLRLSSIGEFAFDPQVLSAWRMHACNTSRDQMFMLEEHLAAQCRVAPMLGLDEDQLDKLQTRTRFNRAEDFLRLSDKRTAFRLMSQNLTGVRSLGALMRMAGRLIAPASLMRKHREAHRKRCNEEFGSIEL